MKNKMKYFLSGMLVMFLFTTSIAQTVDKTATVEQKTATIVDEMTKAGSLTTDQVSLVTPFVTEFFKQKEIDDAEHAGNSEQLQLAKKNRRDVLFSQLKTVLSEQQLYDLKLYWEKAKNKNKEENTNVTE